ncbi:sigma-54-dependent transcriptional regulator [Marinobacterium lutimaris]|uniref:DNA-binding transcriptional response regulator, NtrC family, contains REC, AAA-type ATPase, and a Fis-type DNA-binding domains n=1 Tax=Marinobacterium lutimaris TaxID=568106 RepID=A0A1H6CG93_9GAMM|nr:sigma-54 dependent transcriptional regulator [Marinobacterium lutimaris]SEG72004.1 DNA-binding transcriptional response regulator, NtrC family, contains REC, AAA-type ATPase, and a Fis-type DNA-binding domains [Marinobacterium lutimaris]
MSTRADLNASILIVEDDSGLRELIQEELQDAGYQVSSAGSAEQAGEQIARTYPDLVISDLRLPGEDGLSLLKSTRSLAGAPAFIVITAFGTIEQAVSALQLGADDFLTKPLNLEHLRLSVARALERQALEREVDRYRRMLNAGDFHDIIGRSTPMRQLFEQIRRIAQADGPVLVGGESGAGKERVARAIHAESERHNGPFVAINCAGIPAELLESELFGHKAGAFTGAQKARKGLFAEADGGTLLLDEIGEMPLQMQSKLLRVLQEGSIRPVGDNHEHAINVRIIAATNRDLEQEVEKEVFRADLFYRLETFSIEIPPLRQRGDDIDLLTAHYIARFGATRPEPVTGISTEAQQLLRQYPFPGNVRELANAIERASVFARHEQIQPEDLPARIRRHSGTQPESSALLESLLGGSELPPLRQVEQRYVQHVLERSDGNKRQAALTLGIGRRTLYRYLEESS